MDEMDKFDVLILTTCYELKIVFVGKDLSIRFSCCFFYSR